MDIVSPRVLREYLDKHNLSPNVRLGQNFLVDANILRKIISSVTPEEGDLFIEVGPGAGALTQAVAKMGAGVLAIEIDRGLVSLLRGIFQSHQRVHILEGDATKLDLANLTLEYLKDTSSQRAKFVSNLPYYASSDILYKVLRRAATWDSITVMLQREVAERLVAPPGNASYGSLSVITQAVAQAAIAFRVPASAFWPKPDVESALLTITPFRRPSYGDYQEEFLSLVRAAFGQRRKALSNSLKSLGMSRELTLDLLNSAGIDPNRRAETLSHQEFCLAAHELRKRRLG